MPKVTQPVSVPQGGLLSIPRMTTVCVGSFLSLVPMQEGMVSALPRFPGDNVLDLGSAGMTMAALLHPE